MTEEIELTETPAGRTFDFTGPAQLLEGEQKSVYFRLRRVALLAGDKKALPDGKVYTEAQVVEILGEDYAVAVLASQCCR